MLEVTGNLWTHPADFRVITTNGAVRRDGCAVMGRGCAREAAIYYPKLPRLLGDRITRLGNRVHFFSDLEINARTTTVFTRRGLFTFPVKHHWKDRADLDLIRSSVESFARQLLESAVYVMPRPGCGNGHLCWEAVRPFLVDLPDNVHVIDFGKP